MSSKDDVEEESWNSTEDWLLSMNNMLDTIPMPPTDVPAFGSSQKFSESKKSSTKRRTSSYFSESDTDRDLVFAFCTHENVNVLTDIFDRLRKLAINQPQVFLKHQIDAVERVKSMWEKDHSEAEKHNIGRGIGSRLKSAGDMLVGFAASGFKKTGGLQSENVGATLKLDSAVLSFDRRQIGECCEGKIRLSSKSIKKCSFNVNHIPSKVDTASYDLTVSPDSGVKISVDSACEICVKCRIDSSNTELNELLVLEFNRSSEASSSKRTIKRLAALVSMRTGKAVFGVPYKDLELCEKSGVRVCVCVCVFSSNTSVCITHTKHQNINYRYLKFLKCANQNCSKVEVLTWSESFERQRRNIEWMK